MNRVTVAAFVAEIARYKAQHGVDPAECGMSPLAMSEFTQSIVTSGVFPPGKVERTPYTPILAPRPLAAGEEYGGNFMGVQIYFGNGYTGMQFAPPVKGTVAEFVASIADLRNQGAKGQIAAYVSETWWRGFVGDVWTSGARPNEDQPIGAPRFMGVPITVSAGETGLRMVCLNAAGEVTHTAQASAKEIAHLDHKLRSIDTFIRNNRYNRGVSEEGALGLVPQPPAYHWLPNVGTTHAHLMTEPGKCTCSMTVILRSGCKCGGV